MRFFCFFLATVLASLCFGTTIVCDPQTGYLRELRMKKGENLITPSSKDALWNFTLRDSDGNSNTFGPADASAFSQNQTGNRQILTWSGVGSKKGGNNLRVRVTIDSPENSAKAFFRIDISGQADGELWDVDFPRICGIRSLGKSRLAVPLYLGRIATDPAKNGYSLEMSYPQAGSMQSFVHWTLPTSPDTPLPPNQVNSWLPDESTAAGLYFAAEDGAGFHKHLGVKSDREANTFTLHIVHYPNIRTWPIKSGERKLHFRSRYPVAVAAFTGDVHEGAKLYQDWAKKQIWCRRGTQDDWPTEAPKPGSQEEALWTPNWFRELACWLKYYHEPSKILPEFNAYQKWLQVPMASHWYRYNIAKFDDNYNEMLPGDAYLLAGVRDAKAMSVQPLPYINGVIWDTDTVSWQRDRGIDSAIIGTDGEFAKWDIHGEIFAYMCPTEQWRKTIRDTARKLVGEQGMSGYYLDCLAATATRACYNPAHGHGVHGGSYRAEGNRNLMYELRADSRNYSPDACYFTEEIGEIFLDVMDGFLTLDYLRSYCRPGERVFPFFSLVYHPYTINFGSDGSIASAPDHFRLQMGRILTWGAQPLLSSQVARPPVAGDANSEFLREVVHAFDQAKFFLTGGHAIPIATSTAPTAKGHRAFEVSSAEHHVVYNKLRKRKITWNGPSVLASAWKRQDRYAVLMVNVSDKAQETQLTIRSEELESTNQLLFEPIWPEKIAIHSDANVYKLTLPPASVCVLATPGSRKRQGGECRSSNVETDFNLLMAEGDSFPEQYANAQSPVLVGWSCKDAVIRHQRHGKQWIINPMERREDGSISPRRAFLPKTHEGHALPSEQSKQPFLLLQPAPLAIREGTIDLYSADDNHLLTALEDCPQPPIPSGQLPLVVASDLQSGKNILDLQYLKSRFAPLPWPKNGKQIFGTLGEFDTGNLPTSLAKAFDKLFAHPTNKTLANASRTLADAWEKAAHDPQKFTPGSMLTSTATRLRALLCARTAMLPHLELENDWLAPGIPKHFSITPAPGFSGRQPTSIKVIPVGDWQEDTVEITRTQVVGGTHHYQITLHNGNYVERLVPVLFLLKINSGSHTFHLPEILYLQANRPIHLIKPHGNFSAVSGHPAQATFLLRNWSPIDLNCKLKAIVPTGWKANLAGEQSLPAGKTGEVPLTVFPPENITPEAYQVGIQASWGNKANTAVTTYAQVAVSEAYSPYTTARANTPSTFTSVRFRNQGQMVIFAEKGKKIDAILRNIRVTIYKNDLIIALKDPNGKSVYQCKIPVDKEKRLDYVAQTTGVYTLDVIPGSGSAEIVIPNSMTGEVVSKQCSLKIFNEPFKRVFYVPENARLFRYGSKDGGADETASVKITAPGGRIALERDINEKSPGKATEIKVLPGEGGNFWTIEVDPRQDIEIWLEGDATPILCPSPERAIIGRKKIIRDN